MKKTIAILEPAVYAAALAAAYYYLTAPLAGWVDTFKVFSTSGDIYAALLIINAIATVEIAFFYRLRKLGTANLRLISTVSVADLSIPVVAGVAVGIYWGVTRIFAGFAGMYVARIPLPQTTSDWVILIALIIVTASGTELLLRGFIVASLYNKRGLPLWLVGIVSVIIAFIPIVFFPGNALGFAVSTIPLVVYYIVRRNFWGAVIAQGLFLSGTTVMSVIGVF